MRRGAAVTWTIFIASLAGCDPLSGISGISQEGCGWFFDPRPCVALEIHPSGLNVLRGDTIRLTTFSDSGFARSTWTMTGSAAAFVGAGAELTKEITAPDTTALMKAVDAGSSELLVKSAGSVHSARMTVAVADSSGLVTLTVALPWFQSDTIKAGSQFFVLWQLRDASGALYLARPTSWSSSDVLVVSMVREPCPGAGCGAPFRANTAGTAEVTASFLGLRDTVRINVVP